MMLSISLAQRPSPIHPLAVQVQVPGISGDGLFRSSPSSFLPLPRNIWESGLLDTTTTWWGKQQLVVTYTNRVLQYFTNKSGHTQHRRVRQMDNWVSWALRLSNLMSESIKWSVPGLLHFQYSIDHSNVNEACAWPPHVMWRELDHQLTAHT